MTMPVAFSPIEEALADWYVTALDARDITVPVFNSVPRTGRPPRYLLVLHPGGSLANRITDRPRVVTEVVDEYGTAAAELAKVVRALINSAAPGYIGDIWVDKATDLGQRFSQDPDTNAPRYLITT